MVELALSLTGLHARNESTIQATQDWERGRIDSRTLSAAFHSDCDALVTLQKEVGADYISDGQLTTGWQDFLTPLTNGLEGVKKGAMVRWYNTNTFYYTPIVTGPVSSDGNAISSKVERRYARQGSLRVAIPDPLTFSELAEDHHYGSREKLMFAYAEALNGELRSLERNGVSYVQFSSPALVARFRQKPVPKDELRTLGEAVRTALKRVSLRTGFHTIFGDASPYIPEIFDSIPSHDLGFDFTQTDPDSLTQTKKGIIAGIADARSTYLESEDELHEKVEQVLHATGTKRLTLSPSSDLRYIPRVSADEKLRRLGALKLTLKGESS
jgi:5-methyltetrahydropteroyltriglutamate--homocysteine methyltransferase